MESSNPMSDAQTILHNLRTNRYLFDYDTVRSVVPSGYAGWYSIWVGGRCVYVGTSDSDVRGRLLQHLRESHNLDLDDHIEYNQASMYFSAEIAQRGENVWDDEAWLIDQLGPSTNIQRPGW